MNAVMDTDQTVHVDERVRRLPLWQPTLDEMRTMGLAYRKEFETSWLSAKLGCASTSIQFGVAIAAINDQIIPEGYYLSERGMGGKCYHIVPPNLAEQVAHCKVAKVFRELKRSMLLFGGIARNPTAGLADEAKRRLLALEEKQAFRLLLLRKSQQVVANIQKHAPKLLEKN